MKEQFTTMKLTNQELRAIQSALNEYMYGERYQKRKEQYQKIYEDKNSGIYMNRFSIEKFERENQKVIDMQLLDKRIDKIILKKLQKIKR